MLFIDCSSGVAGDMLGGALLALLSEEERAEALATLNGLGLGGVEFSCHTVTRCGVEGLKLEVRVNGEEELPSDAHGDAQGHGRGYHEHHHGNAHSHGNKHHHHAHRGLDEIVGVIATLDMPSPVRDDAVAVFESIARTEAQVHGSTLHDIHFHEVGTLDAVADVVCTSYLMHLLDPEHVVASPVCTGFGHVHCAHGVLPVPAPATALLLEGIPTYAGSVESELCTPTGAALIRRFADDFAQMPPMTVSRIGYGMGTKELPTLNGVRVVEGEAFAGSATDTVVELECNIDDATGEALGFAVQQLMEAGARDAFVVPIIMKKGRPAHLLTVITDAEHESALVEAVFRLTPTIGIRRKVCERYVLEREEREVETAFGPIRVKTVTGYGVRRSKPEYEDVARVARELGTSIDEARTRIMKAIDLAQ